MTKGYDEWDITFQKDFKAVILENGDLYMSQIGDEFADIFLIKKELVVEFTDWLTERKGYLRKIRVRKK